MATNKRIYYAIQQVKIGGEAVHGLQSAGITTNFNLEQVFELGQLEIYQNIEGIPDIEVTLNKVLDGYKLLYVLATETGADGITDSTAVSPTLAGRQNARCDLELSIYPDTQESAANSSKYAVECDGMYVSSVSYTFPVDGNFTEDVTLVGNNKIWKTNTATGAFANNDDEPLATQGVNRRQHLNMDACKFPTQIPGIDSNGTNPVQSSGEGRGAHFQNITVSVDLGREPIFELGSFAPYHRYATFPVEVTSEFEVLAIQGDGINATEQGYYTGTQTNPTVAATNDGGCDSNRFNLLNQTIYIETCEGTKIALGSKNKLTSVNYGGGDTGGGNVTVTYSYQTFNDFTVAHTEGNYYGQVSSGGYTGS